MACPNFKNGPKNGLGPFGVKGYISLNRNVLKITNDVL
jgi:hypothetical protein